MAEQRRTPRRIGKATAQAILSSRTAIDCSIRDLSSTGARLGFRNATFLPRTFRLRFNAEVHGVTVVWRRGLFAGVRFDEPLRLPNQPLKRRGLWFLGR